MRLLYLGEQETLITDPCNFTISIKDAKYSPIRETRIVDGKEIVHDLFNITDLIYSGEELNISI
jgi:hypothetical protein